MAMAMSMSELWSKLVSLVKLNNNDFQIEELDALAVPGLMTLLDTALYRSVEGQLTATVISAHCLLSAWLDLKRQAVKLLNCLQRNDDKINVNILPGSRLYAMESFARTCLDVACDAIQKITNDPFAVTANVSSETALAGNTLGSTTVTDSVNDTGRRTPVQQRGKDCWESHRLFCPDYIWADDVALQSQRLLRMLLKNPFVTTSLDNDSFSMNESRQNHLVYRVAEQEASVLMLVVTVDLPARLVQFRASVEADAVVSKRLYLVKSEYRVPFRSYLEAHQSLQQAPSLELVNAYIKLPKSKVEQERINCKDELQELLSSQPLVEALALEQKSEEYEVEMAKALYSFSELARYLDHKRARLNDASNGDIVLRDTLRRLKGVLCRKAGPDSSTGIRPILLDLQGVPRDEEKYSETDRSYFTSVTEESKRVGLFIQQLQRLQEFSQTRYSFIRADKRAELDIPSSIVRGCEEFDHELFHCYFDDWLAMVKRQHELARTNDFDRLTEKIRRAEMKLSLVSATCQSLDVVRSRLEAVAADCQNRLHVLHDMIKTVSMREMNLYVKVNAPAKDKTLSLQPTSSLGIFGLAMQMAGETLPLG